MSAPNTGDRSTRTDPVFPLQGGASASLLVGIGLALVVEGVALHFWIAARHPAWAWAITGLNAATLVWLWLHYRARTLATLTLGDRDVVIAVGNQLRCHVPRSAIASAESATWRAVPDPHMARDYVNSARPLEPNVMLTFRASEREVLSSTRRATARRPAGVAARDALARAAARSDRPDAGA